MAGFVELYRLNKTYATAKGPAVIVDEFNLNIREGEFVSLIGHSGCGKSTVLGMIAGLIPKTSGSVVVARREVVGPGTDRGVVFQSPCLLPWMTAIENVQLAVDQVLRHSPVEERVARAAEYLRLVGLRDSLHCRVGSLSQGMKQRVGIARATAYSPAMLLLDEPFGMLDSLTRMELQEVVLSIVEQESRTTLMVTHDVDEALFMSDRIVMMTNGPNARVGEILDVPFARPRERVAALEHPEYYRLRERMIDFLTQQENLKHVHAAPVSSLSKPVAASCV